MFKVPEKLQPIADAPRNIQILMVIGVVLILLSTATLIVAGTGVVRRAH